MMQASKMFPCSSGASWLWWAWTAVPCSPDQATTGTRQTRCWELSCGLAGLAGIPPAAGKAGPKSIDGPMIGKISTPCRLRDQTSERASSPS